MYLLDTNIISELRKQERMNPGVARFVTQAQDQGSVCYLSVITLGELRRGIDLIYHRGDQEQATILEHWFTTLLVELVHVRKQSWHPSCCQGYRKMQPQRSTYRFCGQYASLQQG